MRRCRLEHRLHPARSPWRRAVAGAAVLGLTVTCTGERAGSPELAAGAYLVDATEAAGLGQERYSFGLGIGDVDGDGFEDLVLSNHDQPSLRFNVGGDFGVARRWPVDWSGKDPHIPLLADVDGDGRVDLYLMRGADDGFASKRNALFLNTGEGFAEVAQSGLEDPKGRSRGVGVLDWDGDGMLDFYLANAARPDGPDRLLARPEAPTPGTRTREELEQTFEPVAGAPSVVMPATGTVLAADLDGDGDVDLLPSTMGSRPLTLFERRADGWRPRRLGRFGHLFGLAAGDYDNDGDLDVYLAAGDSGSLPFDVVRPQPGRISFAVGAGGAADPADRLVFRAGRIRVRLYRPGDLRRTCVGAGGHRVPSRSFTLEPREAAGEPACDGVRLWYGPAGEVGAGGGGAWHLDLVAGTRVEARGDVSAPGIELTGAAIEGREGRPAPRYRNTLLVNQAGELVDRTDLSGLMDDGSSRGAAWLDVDDDGDLDLLVVNAGAGILGDQPDTLFVSSLDPFSSRSGGGEARFTALPLAAEERGRGDTLAVFDADLDGALDVVVSNGFGTAPVEPGPYRLWRGRPGAGHWLEARLRRLDEAGAHLPVVGTRLHLQAGGVVQHRWVMAGTYVFRSAGTLTQHFGLGPESGAWLTIDWPDGRRQRLGVGADRLYVVPEP